MNKAELIEKIAGDAEISKKQATAALDSFTEAIAKTLKKGDKVVAMGVLGTVVKVQDQTVILRMFDGSKIEFLKQAITDVSPVSEEESKKIEPLDA